MTFTAAETHRWFQIAKHDRWYREQCPVTAGNYLPLASALQVSRTVAQRIVRGVMNVSLTHTRTELGRGISDEMLARVQPLIQGVETGRLVFWRKGYAWLVPPSDHILAQRSLVAGYVWDYWRECMTCGGRKWLPIWIKGGPREGAEPWVACYRCNAPSQWRSFGAIARHEVLAAKVLPEILLGDEHWRASQLEMPQPAVRQ